MATNSWTRTGLGQFSGIVRNGIMLGGVEKVWHRRGGERGIVGGKVRKTVDGATWRKVLMGKGFWKEGCWAN
jgi:hypothetical protein